MTQTSRVTQQIIHHTMETTYRCARGSTHSKSHDAGEYTMANHVCDMLSVAFPIMATILQGEIVSYSYLASVTSDENEHYNVQYNSSARYNIPTKECTLWALFHVFRELFCVDRDTILFMARDGGEFTISLPLAQQHVHSNMCFVNC